MTTKLWLDFETRSLLNIKHVGTDRYVRDESTEVLMLAYAFDDGEVNIWLPVLGEPMPQAVHEAMVDPNVQKLAWNYGFERGVFAHKLGYQTKRSEWFDPSVLAGYMSLPIGLDRASKALALNEAEKKIKTLGDDRLTKVFSQQTKRKKNELKKNPSLAPLFYRDWNTDPEKWQDFIDYCKNDVRAERAVWYAEVGMNCPMPYEEIQVWLLDQRMNDTGVYIDLTFVKNAADYAAVEVAGIITELKELTGLENPNSTTHQLKPWLKERGYPFDSCAKEYIEEAVKEAKRFKIQPLALEVLKLKQKLGGSAYSKLETILDRVSQDGRLRNQFLYHGAHTGRWSGRGVQLQNLFKPNDRVNMLLDEITQAIRSNTLDLAKIMADYNVKAEAWNTAHPTEKPKSIFGVQPNNLKPITMMEAICGTIRSAFCAPPGSKLVMCDLSQIESRVLAVLAGCTSMMDAYKAGADLYLDFMAWLLDKPLNKKEHKNERQRGKVVILGCFEENTLVLTDSGWKRILDVEKTDLVFDGLNFVAHGGVIAQGKKEVLPVCGVGVTPDHKFLSKGWVNACRLQKSIQLEQQASSLGIGSFLSIDSTRFPLDTCASAKGVTNASLLTKLTWKKGELGHAYPVLTDGFGKNKTGYTSDGHTSPEKSSTDLQTDTTPSSLALDRLSEDAVGSDTLVEELRTDSRVSMTSSGTSRLSTDMNLLAWRLTESIMTDTTNEETSGSLPDEKISKTEVDTFDILNAGPNSRFMILTTSGPMIVHNCGFGMGVDKFIEYAATFGVELTEKEAKDAVYGFREKYKEIPAFWKALDSAVKKALNLRNCVYVNGGIVVDGRNETMLKIKLPNGRCLHYYKARIEAEQTDYGVRDSVVYESWDAKGRQIKRLYGGLICENIVQAVARDVMVNGMYEAEKLGFVIVMTIHDELVCEVAVESGLSKGDLEKAMVKKPEWADEMDFLAAEGDENGYYRK